MNTQISSSQLLAYAVTRTGSYPSLGPFEYNGWLFGVFRNPFLLGVWGSPSGASWSECDSGSSLVLAPFGGSVRFSAICAGRYIYLVYGTGSETVLRTFDMQTRTWKTDLGGGPARNDNPSLAMCPDGTLFVLFDGLYTYDLISYSRVRIEITGSAVGSNWGALTSIGLPPDDDWWTGGIDVASVFAGSDGTVHIFLDRMHESGTLDQRCELYHKSVDPTGSLGTLQTIDLAATTYNYFWGCGQGFDSSVYSGIILPYALIYGNPQRITVKSASGALNPSWGSYILSGDQPVWPPVTLELAGAPVVVWPMYDGTLRIKASQYSSGWGTAQEVRTLANAGASYVYPAIINGEVACFVFDEVIGTWYLGPAPTPPTPGGGGLFFCD